MSASPSEETAYLLAIRYLGYRPRSVKEIREYLQKKQVTEIFIATAIAKLLEQKFLDDESFAQMWVRTRVALKPLSQRVLKMELIAKGIAKETIEQVLVEQEEVSGSDGEMARVLIQKKKRLYEGMSKKERYEKLGGFLARRGFDYQTIKRSIDDVFGS